jgi:hypothetical protein
MISMTQLFSLTISTSMKPQLSLASSTDSAYVTTIITYYKDKRYQLYHFFTYYLDICYQWYHFYHLLPPLRNQWYHHYHLITTKTDTINDTTFIPNNLDYRCECDHFYHLNTTLTNAIKVNTIITYYNVPRLTLVIVLQMI